MTRLVFSMPVLLLWAVQASAAEVPCTLRMEPTVATITCPLVPVPPVVPPVTPPVTPPIVPPPVTPPAVDNTPFPFPERCIQNTDVSARYFTLAVLPTGPIYAGLSAFGNPLPISHICVGMLAPGASFGYGPPPNHTTPMPPDLMLWAPSHAPIPYGQLRCILATGRPCP